MVLEMGTKHHPYAGGGYIVGVVLPGGYAPRPTHLGLLGRGHVRIPERYQNNARPFPESLFDFGLRAKR